MGGDAEGKFTVEFLLLPEGLAEEEEAAKKVAWNTKEEDQVTLIPFNYAKIMAQRGERRPARRGRRETIPEDTDTLRGAHCR